ncbi:30S ribosomal protein S8, partial [Paraburkholderia sp. SIMBA_050]
MGHGMRTGVVQFIKGAIPSGEEMFLQRFSEECEFHVMGEGYTWETQDRARDVAKAEAAWDIARRMLRDPAIGLVLFDELNIALKYYAGRPVIERLERVSKPGLRVYRGRNDIPQVMNGLGVAI